MSLLPSSLNDVITSLGRLPGVGPRTAERYALSLLKMNERDVSSVASSISKLKPGIKSCPVTYALIDSTQDISRLYSDPTRDKQQIMVVENFFDIVAVEKTSSYKGTYHVLGGALSPIDGIGPEQLTIIPLLKRLKEDSATELIIGTNASVEGESTALYLKQVVEEQGLVVRVTRLARGIPAGTDLEYADQITLTRALTDRQSFGAQASD